MALSTIPFSGLGADASNQGVNFRNLIINGDMSIAQRGTSSTGQTGAGYKTLDRFRINLDKCWYLGYVSKYRCSNRTRFC
jgi:hypothetical protein